MKTPFTRIPGLGRRNKTLLIAAGALLVIVLAAGATLALGARLPNRLAGAAVAPGASDFKLKPHSAGDADVALARSTWAFFNNLQDQGYYVGLYPWDADNTANRWWNKETASVGYKRIYNLEPTGSQKFPYARRYLAVRDASDADGADVVAWTSASTGGNDEWQFEVGAVDRYLIRNKKSGKCLDVRAGDHALVQQPCDANKHTQLWQMITKK